MATRRWAGAAPRVRQVNTFAFGGTWEADDTIKASCSNGKSYLFTAGSATTATVVANLVALWNALSAADYPELREVTASGSSTTFTLTGGTAGKPFVISLRPYESNGTTTADSQTIEGGTGATAGTVATACSSPNRWGVAANWLENSVPVTGDDVVLGQGPSILDDLDQSAVTLASLKILPSYLASNEIGLPENTNPTSPASGYPEYRDKRLKIGATVVDVECDCQRLRLDLSPASTTVTVRATGQPKSPLEDALDLKLAATATVHVIKGSVGVNNQPGDTGTVADLNVSFRDNPASDAKVRGGAGLTVTNLDMSGGDVSLLNGATTVTKTDGTLTLQGAATTVRNRGGRLYLDGTGTIATLENGGECYRRGFAAITITTLRLFAGSRGGAGDAPVTYTNPVEFYECRPAGGPEDRGRDVAHWDFGRHKKFTPAAI